MVPRTTPPGPAGWRHAEPRRAGRPDRRFWALLLLPLLLAGLVFTGATVLASGATYINDRPGLTIPGGGWLGGHDPAPLLVHGAPILED